MGKVKNSERFVPVHASGPAARWSAEAIGRFRSRMTSGSLPSTSVTMMSMWFDITQIACTSTPVFAIATARAYAVLCLVGSEGRRRQGRT